MPMRAQKLPQEEGAVTPRIEDDDDESSEPSGPRSKGMMRAGSLFCLAGASALALAFISEQAAARQLPHSALLPAAPPLLALTPSAPPVLPLSPAAPPFPALLHKMPATPTPSLPPYPSWPWHHHHHKWLQPPSPSPPSIRLHQCRSHCPPARVPLRLVQAAAFPESTEVDSMGEWTSGSDQCIDGSRMSFCLVDGTLAAAQGQMAWLSAQVQPPSAQSAVAIHSVDLTLYHIWSGRFAPFEVWLGDGFGALQKRCNVSGEGGGHTEPSHFGVPLSADCHSGRHAFVTLRQAGAPRRWMVSELRAFSPSSAPRAANGATVPLANGATVPLAGEVARQIAWRFEHGRPSNELAEGGVLIHIEDGNEDTELPWLLCEHERCTRGKSDAWSASLISRTVPWLFTDRGLGGFIIAPDASIMCAFPADAGTLGSAQRPGQCSGLYAHGFHGTSLKDALQRQYDGSWRHRWHGAALYNEVLVGVPYWRDNLPWALEAFVCGLPCSLHMRQQHAAFLAHYNLTSEEVPLLQYRCAQSDPTWDPALGAHGGSTREAGTCFEEVITAAVSP